MEGTWAYHWVQRLRHQRRWVGVFLLGLGLIAAWGWQAVDIKVMHSLGLALAALLLMSLVSIKLLDSFKSALLLFVFSLFLLFYLVGLSQVLSLGAGDSAVFGWVVVLIMLMSNLIHLITSLLREMARGAHQFDAIAEAVRLNASPILLSNTTTLLGFLSVAWFDEQYQALAEVVFLGWCLIAIVLLVAFPSVLMKWLLEFRVGNYEDRHGFLFIADYLQAHPLATRLLVGLAWGLSALAIWQVIGYPEGYSSMLIMLAGSGVLLLLVWQHIGLALGVLWVSCVSVVLALGLSDVLVGASGLWLTLGLVIPLGIVLDDGIHFFSRIRRAKSGFYRDDLSAIRFALSSIGRPIWNTTVLLWVGLLTLLASGNSMVFQLSFVTLAAMLIACVAVLVLLPAIYIRKSL